jgi:predicted membrane channel-forming protein YqfA (hemolysin III family)
VASFPLNFPPAFCCNCGDTNCEAEVQDTRLTRFHDVNGTELAFQLAIPVCAACVKTTKRQPPGWYARVLVWVLMTCVVFLLLLLLARAVELPAWAAQNLLAISAGLALVMAILFYRWRRPTAPQTSFYQPVRIKGARLHFRDGEVHVLMLKLAFTNHEYFNVFSTANRDLIESRRVVVNKA